MLTAIGLSPQNWLFSTPILAVSIANIWRGTAFSMLVYSAALSEVPKEIEEAAEMDGAGTLARLHLRHAADDPALDHDQPDADHAADAVGLRPDLHHDPGRTGQQEPDAAAVHVPAGVQFSQLGYGTAIALVLLLVGARVLAGLPAGTAVGGRPVMTSTTAARTVRPQRAATAAKGARSGAGPSMLVRRVAVNLVLLLIAACYLVPLLWLVLASFNTTAGPAVAWPDRWTFDNFRAVLTRTRRTGRCSTALILCGGAAIVTMVCAVLAAYPLSRYRSRMQAPVPAHDPVLDRAADHRDHGAGLRAVRAGRPDRHDLRHDPVHGHHGAAVRDLADEELHGRRADRPGGGRVDRRRLRPCRRCAGSSCR